MIDLSTALDRAEGSLRRAWRAAISRLLARNPWADVTARYRLQGIDAALVGLTEAAEEVSAGLRHEILLVAALMQRALRARAPFAFDITHWRFQDLLRTMEDTLVRVLRTSAKRAVEEGLPGGVGLGLDQVELLASYDKTPRENGPRMTAQVAVIMRAHQEDRIALWLAQVAVNETAIQAANQAIEFGAIPSAYLVWNTRQDPQVRDSHEGMHDQRRPIGQSFRSGLGNALRFPGDPRAPDRDRRGCRCGLTVGF